MIPESYVTFAGESLDRADHLRGDETALIAMAASAESRALPFWRGKTLFDIRESGPTLAWVSATDDIVTGAPDRPLFLGLDANGVAHFAVDASYIAPPDEKPA